jgi:HSP20 family molecular chaperone IbpA
LEVYFGPFERAVQLPQQVPVDRERLSAVYKDGFLIVTLPKLPVAVNKVSRQIAIAAGEDEVRDTQDVES